MTAYQIEVTAHDGMTRRRPVICASDADALALGERILGGGAPAEIWRGLRLIGIFTADDPGSDVPRHWERR